MKPPKNANLKFLHCETANKNSKRALLADGSK